ncbi:MAG: single-stranded DNA-binding protein, partial [Geminicoccaceae bacterium]
PDPPLTPAEDGRASKAGAGACAPRPLPHPDRKSAARVSQPVLAPAESGVLRGQLEAEIASLADEDALLAWAHRRLPAKNMLTPEDARTVEQAFAAKLRALETSDQSRRSAGEDAPEAPSDPVVTAKPAAESDHMGAVLALTKPRRRRDKDHLAFVAAQPRLVCGRQPCDAHHLRFAQPRALGRKVSDEFTVPLCRLHHRALHARGDEQAWWALQIDPAPVAQQLWDQTR